MPKLLFTPEQHIIGENEDIFITAAGVTDSPICIKCNDVAAFIIMQMYPEHTPRVEIIPKVVEKFGCTEEEATQAVEDVINGLLRKGDTVDE